MPPLSEPASKSRRPSSAAAVSTGAASRYPLAPVGTQGRPDPCGKELHDAVGSVRGPTIAFSEPCRRAALPLRVRWCRRPLFRRREHRGVQLPAAGALAGALRIFSEKLYRGKYTQESANGNGPFRKNEKTVPAGTAFSFIGFRAGFPGDQSMYQSLSCVPSDEAQLPKRG